MRTIVYSRVSTDVQAEEGTSLDTQERAGVKYAEEAGQLVIRTLRDTASGMTLDRPGIAEVRRMMRDGECEVVLAYALDRLSRNQNHIGVLMSEAEDAGVRLDLVTESLDDTAIGKFIIAARALVAEIEREKITERTMRGKAERARNGQIPQGTGAGCYGYIYVPKTGKRVLNPEQVRVVVRIFMDFIGGKSCNRIATELNAEGVPAFGGGPWHAMTIARILKNETYTGRTVYGRTKVVKTRSPGKPGLVAQRVEQDPSNHIVIEGASPQIVSRDLFERVQARFADPERKAKRAPSHDYPLRGRLRCGHCGARMAGVSVQKGRYFYYRCNRKYVGDKDQRCPSKQIWKEVLESAVREAVEKVLAQPALAIEMAERLQNGTDHSARLAELEREIERVAAGEGRLVDLYTDGQIAKDVLDAKHDTLMRRKGVLERERAQLRAESDPGPDPELLRKRMPEVLAFIGEWVRQADGDDFQLLIQALDVRAEVATDERAEVATHEVDVRVEVPMIGGLEGTDFVTIEQTSGRWWYESQVNNARPCGRAGRHGTRRKETSGCTNTRRTCTRA